MKAEIEKVKGGYILTITGMQSEFDPQHILALTNAQDIARVLLPLMVSTTTPNKVIFTDFESLIERLKDAFGEK